MGVIVTRNISTGSGGASGSGAYTLSEKSNMEMEMEFKAAYLCYYKELTYNVQKQLTNIGIWVNSAKILKLFNKNLSYNPQKQLTQTDLTRISDVSVLTSVFAYNAQKQLISITRSGTACGPSSSSSSSSLSSSSSSTSVIPSGWAAPSAWVPISGAVPSASFVLTPPSIIEAVPEYFANYFPTKMRITTSFNGSPYSFVLTSSGGSVLTSASGPESTLYLTEYDVNSGGTEEIYRLSLDFTSPSGTLVLQEPEFYKGSSSSSSLSSSSSTSSSSSSESSSSSTSSSSSSTSSSSSSESSSSSTSSSSSSTSSSSSSESSSSSTSSSSSSTSSSSTSSSSTSSSSTSTSTSYEPFENFFTYTEVDEDSDITIVSPVYISFNTLRRDAVSYVYKDFGAGYFGDFEIDFEFKIDSSVGAGSSTQFISISNTIGTLQDQTTANDGIMVFSYGGSGVMQITLRDYNTDDGDTYVPGGTSTSLLYCTISRVGSTATCLIYSDSDRTSLVDTLTITCETGTKRYLNALGSRDATNGGTDNQTGYVQYYHISSSSSSTSSSSTSSSSTSSSSSSESSSSSTSSSSTSSSSTSSSSLSSSSTSSSSFSTIDLLAFTEGSEIVSGGDFTGSDGDPIPAWFDANGGNAGNNQEIQNNKAEISNPNAAGTSYIGRASLGKNYLGADGAQIPLVTQLDFTINNNVTDTDDQWYILLQAWESNDDSFATGIGYISLTSPVWTTYGYGTHVKNDTVPINPNQNIINSTDVSGSIRLELVPYQSRLGNWAVEGRAYYLTGGTWTIVNPNVSGHNDWPDGLANTDLYASIHNPALSASVSPATVDNFTAKEITDHAWRKDNNRIGSGFHFDFANGRVIAEDQLTGGTLHFFYPDIYDDGVYYTTTITIEDYVDGECRVWHGDTLLDTLTASGSYVLIGPCDYGANEYDELWLTSTLSSNDYKITQLITKIGSSSSSSISSSSSSTSP